MMHVEHFVITRFCIRQKDVLGSGARSAADMDPLRPAFLEARFRLLEILSSASMAGQTLTSFTWLMLVDPDLDSVSRQRLRALAPKGVRFLMHAYDTSRGVAGNGWLAPYFVQRPDYIVTTYLDDDDALPATYLEELEAAARRAIIQDDPPLIRVFGCKRVWLWNLLSSKRAPLGTRSSWRRKIEVPTCGFSLMSKYPEVPMSIVGMRHKWAEHYLDLMTEPASDHVRAFRQSLRAALAIVGTTAEAQRDRMGFEDVSERTGPVVMGNHLWNAQVTRILEAQVKPTKVLGPESFPGHTLNMAAAEAYVPGFRLPLSRRIRVHLKTQAGMLRESLRRTRDA